MSNDTITVVERFVCNEEVRISIIRFSNVFCPSQFVKKKKKREVGTPVRGGHSIS